MPWQKFIRYGATKPIQSTKCLEAKCCPKLNPEPQIAQVNWKWFKWGAAHRTPSSPAVEPTLNSYEPARLTAGVGSDSMLGQQQINLVYFFLVHLKQLYFLGLWVLRTSYLKGMSREVGIGEGPKIETSETKKVALSHIVHYWVVLWQLCKLCITHNLCYSVSFVVWAAFDCNGHHIDWLSEKRTQRKGAPVRVITSYYYSMLCTFGYSATSSSVPWRQKSELCHSH